MNLDKRTGKHLASRLINSAKSLQQWLSDQTDSTSIFDPVSCKDDILPEANELYETPTMEVLKELRDQDIAPGIVFQPSHNISQARAYYFTFS